MGKNDLPYSAGEYGGTTVTVYRREPEGPIYIRIPNPERPGGYERRSLGHRDVEKAKATADRTAAALREGDERIRRGQVTLQEVLTLYEEIVLPRWSDRHQRLERKRKEFWLRQLGGDRDPHNIGPDEWARVVEARREGRIDARGKQVPEKQQERRSAETVRKDAGYLKKVLAWATRYRDRQGRYVMQENPLRGVSPPQEPSPQRPVASRDTYEALRAVSDSIRTEFTRGTSREEGRSYLSELLDLAVGTGRRIGAIRRLRYEDLRLGVTEARPYGAIRWPRDTDKQELERTVPLGPLARRAVDRVMEERPGVGKAYLFPAPTDPSKPVPYRTTLKWLKLAYAEVEVERPDMGGWHQFRRLWAMERKHLPGVDVAWAGGWQSERTLQTVYEQPDEQTTLQVVLEHGELREQKGSE